MAEPTIDPVTGKPVEPPAAEPNLIQVNADEWNNVKTRLDTFERMGFQPASAPAPSISPASLPAPVVAPLLSPAPSPVPAPSPALSPAPALALSPALSPWPAPAPAPAAIFRWPTSRCAKITPPAIVCSSSRPEGSAAQPPPARPCGVNQLCTSF